MNGESALRVIVENEAACVFEKLDKDQMPRYHDAPTSTTTQSLQLSMCTVHCEHSPVIKELLYEGPHVDKDNLAVGTVIQALCGVGILSRRHR